MNYRNMGRILVLLVGFIYAQGARASDPCDFASRESLVFPYQQVIECYKSVPFNINDLENIVATVSHYRSYSDLAEIYQEKVNWQQNLTALLELGRAGAYQNDLEMHDAFKAEHKRFRNAHVVYTPPGCYWRMLNAFMPFDFGSALKKNGAGMQQVVFIEAARYLPDLYQQATGIDASRYIGMRVVAINGMPVFDYFRAFGRAKMSDHEDDSGNFNAILNNASYSIRLGGSQDFLPRQAADHYLLESGDGRRIRVTMPWVFARGEILLGEFSLPLTKNTAEFVDQCLAPLDPSNPNLTSALWKADAMETDRFRRHALERCHRRGSRSPDQYRDEDFYEVPPELLNKDIREVIPWTGSARVVQYGTDVTSLRLANTVGWIDLAREGIEYACQNSERLIIDLRRNNGGNDTVIEWLHRYLFPEVLIPSEAGKLIERIRNDNAGLNEFLYNSALFDYLFTPNGPYCQIGFSPGCLVDPTTGKTFPVDGFRWYLAPSIEELRGSKNISLTREMGLPYADNPTFDSASCAGRFSGDNLVFLTDGCNASGGYFLPAAFKGKGVIVTMGGLVDEDMAMGRARGGATLSISSFGIAAILMEQLSQGTITFQNEPMLFSRQVDSNIEAAAAYHKDRSALHINDPIGPDIYLDVWSDSPETDGYVYGRVLEALGGHP